MAKVIKPIKEIWETDKKPDCIILSKTGKDSGIVRAKRLKTKKEEAKAKKAGTRTWKFGGPEF